MNYYLKKYKDKYIEEKGSKGNMSKYSNGKIYKILNSIDNEVYVGSTIEPLCKRMWKHRFSSKTRSHYMLYQHMSKLGKEHFYIELIENYPCNNKEELEAKEGQWIRQIGTLNDKIAGRSKKQWGIDNHERRMEQAKQYRDAHKEERKEYDKKRYEQNKEEISKKASEQIMCECGSSISIRNRLRHLRSKKHEQLMEQLCNNEPN